jgi:hypothetical protein
MLFFIEQLNNPVSDGFILTGMDTIKTTDTSRDINICFQEIDA